MKIDLIKLKFNDTCAYKHKPFQYCCDAIQNDKAIVFTGEDLVHSDDCWDDDMIEFHLNESSWCYSNLISELEKYDEKNGCICGICEAKVAEKIGGVK